MTFIQFIPEKCIKFLKMSEMLSERKRDIVNFIKYCSFKSLPEIQGTNTGIKLSSLYLHNIYLSISRKLGFTNVVTKLTKYDDCLC